MQYMLLIYGDEARREERSEQEQATALQRWFAYTDEVRDAGVMVSADALEPTAAATTVEIRKDGAITTDGPFAETKEQLGGYYLIDVDSLDEAIEWASKMPWEGGKVEVRPIMQFATEATSA
jgi:hypothetical protein